MTYDLAGVARRVRDGKCRDDAGNMIELPGGKVEYAWGDHVVIRPMHKLVVFDASTRTSTELDLRGDVERGSGPIISVGDGIYNIVSGKRVGSSATEAVAGHCGNRALIGHAAAVCTPPAGRFALRMRRRRGEPGGRRPSPAADRAAALGAVTRGARG